MEIVNYLDDNKKIDKWYFAKLTQKWIIDRLGTNWIRIIDKTSWTITTEQWRLPNAGFIKIPIEMRPDLKDIAIVYKEKYYLRILTEFECLKLMGFDEQDIINLKNCQKITNGYPTRTQLYRQAGNSIVVNVLECIFKEMATIE